MVKAKNKTTKTSASVEEYIAAIADDQRREDCKRVNAMMQKVSGWNPKMWGPSIAGFGEYHYKYDSGREGDSLRVGWSSRASYISVYIMPGYQDFEDELSRLGKFKNGKACLNIKRLSDIDEAVLEEIVVKGLKQMAEKYPENV